MNESHRTILRSTDASSRWNFDGGPAALRLSFDAARRSAVVVDASGRELMRWDDPFAALDWMAAFDLSATPDARWVGSIGYEFAREVERLPSTTRNDLSFAEAFHFTLWRASLRDASSPAAVPTQRHRVTPSRLVERSMTREAYLRAVARSLGYIAAGDVFQVNLAQRFTFETNASPLAIWNALQSQSPANFGALIEHDDDLIISNSPELFFRIDRTADGSRTIVNRPIKGTRPRGPGMEAELIASVKDKAELAMIVDLQRNDLGRVCEIGSVVVREPRVIETHPTVYHGVATIDGTLRRDAKFSDVVRALFPCGSITGCPKVRAMEIIDELEPVARGPYCGAIGYLAADGTIEFSVAIRTLVMSGGVAHVYVGGGIVADSSPEAEYEETLVKAQALFAALGVDGERTSLSS